MPFLKAIEEEDKVPHVLSKFNTGAGRPMVEYQHVMLRGDSPFSVGERELMAAFVAGINACEYCYGAHKAAAETYGVEQNLLDELIHNIDTANIGEKMKPILHYLHKLTLSMDELTPADADAVYAAGWSERALFDAIQICGLYNLMSRFTVGLGLTPQPHQFGLEGDMIHEYGYTGLIKKFGIK